MLMWGHLLIFINSDASPMAWVSLLNKWHIKKIFKYYESQTELENPNNP